MIKLDKNVLKHELAERGLELAELSESETLAMYEFLVRQEGDAA